MHHTFIPPPSFFSFFLLLFTSLSKIVARVPSIKSLLPLVFSCSLSRHGSAVDVPLHRRAGEERPVLQLADGGGINYEALAGHVGGLVDAEELEEGGSEVGEAAAAELVLGAARGEVGEDDGDLG